MTQKNTLIFAPTYNEQGTIGTLIDALLALPVRSDLLFVDDSSTDGTTEYLHSVAAAEPRVHVIVRPGKLGVGSAHKLGWLYARMHGYSRIVTLDADLSHDPKDVPRLLAALDAGAGADVVVGSRFCPGGRTDYQGWRRFLSLTANRLARLVLRLHVAEYTTSLRAVRLDRVAPGLVESVNGNGYSFFMTCITRLAREGLIIKEVPIHFYDRLRGSSKMPRAAVAQAIPSLLRLALDRRPAEPVGIPQGAERQCPACGAPYRIFVAPGELLCLQCMGTGLEDPGKCS
jgi:dolichol-phosphate mannosyltransferase